MFQNTNRGQGGDTKFLGFIVNLRQVIASSHGKELLQVTCGGGCCCTFVLRITALSLHPDSLHFYAFDLLAFEGTDLRKLALLDRRSLLEGSALIGMRGPVHLSAVFDTSANQLIATAKKTGLEGVIAKRAGSRYESGERSGAWVKYKTNKGQELVIGGYKPGPNGFDYLLAGYYERKELIFIAKIRNGFHLHYGAKSLRISHHLRLHSIHSQIFPNLRTLDAVRQ